ITQLASTVDGLRSVNNPLAASGGGDSEPGESLRKNAPRSALILGRAVSLLDMEAVTLAIPGIRAAQVDWRWNPNMQSPVIQVWYIGEDNIESKVISRLQMVSDPTTAFAVEKADASVVTLGIGIEIDPRYLSKDVLPAVRDQLMNTDTGILA